MTVLPSGELARAITHESDSDYPTLIEIVAYWSKDGSRKGRRRSIEIPADQFFGRGGYGAPITGDQLVIMIEQLRKRKPK
jgi:hypothetical protein